MTWDQGKCSLFTVEGCSPKINRAISPIVKYTEKMGPGKVFTIKRCSLVRGVHYERFHCIDFRSIYQFMHAPSREKSTCNLFYLIVGNSSSKIIYDGAIVELWSRIFQWRGNEFSTGWSRPTFSSWGSGGAVRLQRGPGAESRRQADFDNNLLKIN